MFGGRPPTPPGGTEDAAWLEMTIRRQFQPFAHRMGKAASSDGAAVPSCYWLISPIARPMPPVAPSNLCGRKMKIAPRVGSFPRLVRFSVAIMP